jgi:hypothetical protein
MFIQLSSASILNLALLVTTNYAFSHGPEIVSRRPETNSFDAEYASSTMGSFYRHPLPVASDPASV